MLRIPQPFSAVTIATVGNVLGSLTNYALGYWGSLGVIKKWLKISEEEFVRAEPPSFQHNYSRPNWVGPNQTFDVIVRIFNNGDVNAHDNTVTLNNITGVTVDDGNSHTLSTIV